MNKEGMTVWILKVGPKRSSVFLLPCACDHLFCGRGRNPAANVRMLGPQPSLQMPVAPADILTTTSQETLNQSHPLLLPDFCPTETICLLF